ncbi:MAG: transglycosylase domain-containing protein [Proteobacteria bacterium]|nr:transglycosylase domain-containing protein [Pseudomonadota bacterium]MCP4081790.1 transglycosylase domain-containing protein [Planctomycetaceae bacterium]
MKALITILSLPYFLLGFIFHRKKSINRDLNLCIEYINKNRDKSSKIDEIYLRVLLLAEDHRSETHYGVDPIAIMRCIYVRSTKKITQGGSTIEQQLVRTITSRYERTLRRKIREQVISILLFNRVKDKKIIWQTYLYSAYFGHMKVGFFNLEINELLDPSEMIARLKYPTKKNEIPIENKKIQKRKSHIDSLIDKSTSAYNRKTC